MNKRKDLELWYMNAFDDYAEALQNHAQDAWEDKYGDDSWEEFHTLDQKLKVKFYYEDAE